jgi:predicted HicB family RNase H-like nuclease
MLHSIPKPKKIAKVSDAIRFGVNVRLTAADHKRASLVAKASQETLSAWIASLVNTALMP